MTIEGNPPAQSDRGVLVQGRGGAKLIVCERTGRWAVALRRELPEEAVRIYQTRSLVECWEMLTRCPASFLVIEVTEANVDALLERMCRLQRCFPLARLAVVSERSLAAYESLLREAGAVHYISSIRQLQSLAELACRHLAEVPRSRQSLSEQIWGGLPWAPPDS